MNMNNPVQAAVSNDYFGTGAQNPNGGGNSGFISSCSLGTSKYDAAALKAVWLQVPCSVGVYTCAGLMRVCWGGGQALLGGCMHLRPTLGRQHMHLPKVCMNAHPFLTFNTLLVPC